MAGITSDLAQKNPLQRVSGGSPDDFRRDNIAGSHGTLKRIFAMNIIRENTLKKISETCFLMIHKDKAKYKKLDHTSGEIKSLTFFSTIFS